MNTPRHQDQPGASGLGAELLRLRTPLEVAAQRTAPALAVDERLDRRGLA